MGRVDSRLWLNPVSHGAVRYALGDRARKGDKMMIQHGVLAPLPTNLWCRPWAWATISQGALGADVSVRGLPVLSLRLADMASGAAL